MQKQLLMPIKLRLEKLLANVGDMALKRRARLIIQGLNLQRSDKVLDLGCGTGYYLFLLSNLPVELSLNGLDYDEKALEEAKQSLKDKKIKFFAGDSHNLPFEDNSFDKIVASEVLEHLDDDQKALKEVYRVLRPGGIFVISTPSINYPFFWDPLNWILQHLFSTHIKKGFFSGIWFGHLRLYDLESLKNKFIKAGFKIEDAREITYWCLPFNHYVINIVARLLYDIKISPKIADSISKFKESKKPLLVDLAFKCVNKLDSLNEIFPQKSGVNVFILARKPD